MRQNYRTREGNAARRQLEFAIVLDQVKRRKEAFIARLSSHIIQRGTCLCYEATKDHKGYARLNFRHKGKHISIAVQRVFMILKLCKPIPLAHEAGHTEECEHRTCVRHLQLEHYADNAATYHSHRRAA